MVFSYEVTLGGSRIYPKHICVLKNSFLRPVAYSTIIFTVFVCNLRDVFYTTNTTLLTATGVWAKEVFPSLLG